MRQFNFLKKILAHAQKMAGWIAEYFDGGMTNERIDGWMDLRMDEAMNQWKEE